MSSVSGVPESKKKILIFFVDFSVTKTSKLTIRLFDGKLDPRRMYSMELSPVRPSNGMLGIKLEVIEDTGLGQV